MIKYKFIFILLLFFLLITEFIYFFMILPKTPLRKIIIHANFDVLDSDIYQLAHLNNQMLIMQIDPKEIAQLLEAEDMIEKARVKRGLWGHLHVTLLGYNPSLALITADGNIVFLDKNGYLFSSSKKTGIFPPILHGAILKSDSNGNIRLDTSMFSLLSTLTKLKEIDYSAHATIAGIRAIIEPNNLLYWQTEFIGLQTKALFSNHLTVEDIQRSIIVLTVLEQAEKYLEEVDFRTHEIVFDKGKHHE